ncbi:MAG: tRNA epoxyqueuosine(34) reductase QueG [Thermoguttaceae bacterium]|jgi:epoxyqueuosine reductase
MTPEELTAELKTEARRLGFDLAGAAPAIEPPSLGHFRHWLADGFAGRMGYLASRAAAYEHPDRVLDGTRSLLILAMGYRTVEPAPAGKGQGTVARYAWGQDYHEVVRRRLRALAGFHRRLVPGAAVRGVVDTAPLLEREFARLAGLGWIGKNTMLIHRRLGSWLVLAALLTSETLAYDTPQTKGHCGTCQKCLDACPTGALIAPYRLDARRCISYLTIESREPVPEEFQALLGSRVFGCDACQEVCPWNRRAPITSEPAFQPKGGMNPVELMELVRLDEAAFRKRFAGTALWRAGRQGLADRAALALEHRRGRCGR